jgi:hypothetical protein
MAFSEEETSFTEGDLEITTSGDDLNLELELDNAVAVVDSETDDIFAAVDSESDDGFAVVDSVSDDIALVSAAVPVESTGAPASSPSTADLALHRPVGISAEPTIADHSLADRDTSTVPGPSAIADHDPAASDDRQEKSDSVDLAEDSFTIRDPSASDDRQTTSDSSDPDLAARAATLLPNPFALFLPIDHINHHHYLCRSSFLITSV